MIFITTTDVDTILGSAWATEDKKALAVNQANVWLSTKSFCSGLTPTIDDAIKQAGANLALLSSQNLLYVSRSDGIVTEKSVKADTVAVTKKYAAGSETGKSAEMMFIDDLLRPFLCKGGAVNTWVCK
jgi:hypothetical protein